MDEASTTPPQVPDLDAAINTPSLQYHLAGVIASYNSPNNSKFICGDQKNAQQCFRLPAGENVARPKSRVAQHATGLAAAVARNDYVDPNVAPAHKRNS